MRKALTSTLVLTFAAAALAAAAPALGDAPTRTQSTLSLSFIDDETCAFPIDVTVDRTRDTTTFSNGDVKRHTQLAVTTSANGKTVIEKDDFNVFIDAGSDTWTITGTFTHARSSDGGILALESGRLYYDAVADELIDEHPGPHETDLDAVLCAALA